MPWLLETDAPIADREQQRLLGFMLAVAADQRSLLVHALEGGILQGDKLRISGDFPKDAPGHWYDYIKHNFAQQMTPPFVDYRDVVLSNIPKEEQQFRDFLEKIPMPVLQVLHLNMRQHELPWVDLTSVRILGWLDAVPRDATITYIVQNRQNFMTVIKGAEKPEKYKEHTAWSRLLAYHIYSAMQDIDHFPEIPHGPVLWTDHEGAGMVM